MDSIEIAVLIVKLLPTIIQTVKIVEDAVPMDGKGKEKLDTVVGILQTGNDVAQKLPVESIVGAVNRIVDLFNKTGIFKQKGT